jgi:serine O-acetyltransferase
MAFKGFRDHLDAILARDPAARSRLEVALCYPGLHAVLAHRVAHALWRAGLTTLARFLAHLARWLTGIEIHPGASIGRRLFIDHGMGLVIGETAAIGDDVTLYHGVTLGTVGSGPGKRHPTLRDGVIVGAGASVLGPLEIGAGARIGSNAVVLKDVPAGATVTGIPAREVKRENARLQAFCAYGSDPDLPDPVARAIDSLCLDVAALRERLAQLERELAERPAAADRPKLYAVKGEDR